MKTIKKQAKLAAENVGGESYDYDNVTFFEKDGITLGYIDPELNNIVIWAENVGGIEVIDLLKPLTMLKDLGFEIKIK